MKRGVLVGVASLLWLAGCGGKSAGPAEVNGKSGPQLTPVVEASAWVNKMPGFAERDASDKPIYPGHILVKVYGQADVAKMVIQGQSREIGQFTSDDLVRRDMDKWVEFLVNKELRVDENDTLSIKVWLILGDSSSPRDTVESYLQNVPVRAVY